MKKLLYIAEYFPPVGGAGVQRTSKFVKYLSRHDFQPVVLTSATQTNEIWKPEDNSLSCDIGPDIPIYRAHYSTSEESKHEERRKAFIEKGRQAIEEHQPELILVSMSPFQDADIAHELSQMFSIPWIADLRDPWALDEFQVYRTVFHRIREQKRMRTALRSAAGIIMNTPTASERLSSTFPEIGRKPNATITNGFDEEDFSENPPVEGNSKFRIIHTGTFHTRLGLHQRRNAINYSLFKRCQRSVRILPRSPYYFLKALESIAVSHPDVLKDIEVIFAGVLSEEDKEIVKSSAIAGSVTLTGYLDHAENIRLLQSSDLLFLPLHKVAKSDRAAIVPGKTYEYLASGSPILGALPEGDAKDFLKQAGHTTVVEPDDCEEMAKGIIHHHGEWKKGSLPKRGLNDQFTQFERKRLTKDLASFLNVVLSSPN